LAVLLALFMVEYDFFPPGLFTPLRILCWVASFFVPCALQVRVLCRSPLFSGLSRGLSRLTFSAISFPLTILGLIWGHTLFALAGYGLLFD
jgi:hypothetical protein